MTDEDTMIGVVLAITERQLRHLIDALDKYQHAYEGAHAELDAMRWKPFREIKSKFEALREAWPTKADNGC